jgi:hypothetical protein
LRNWIAELALRRANWLHICASLSMGVCRQRLARKSIWWLDISCWIAGTLDWSERRQPTEYF